MAVIETRTLTVTGMHCSGCEGRAIRALEQLPGVKVLRASHNRDEIQIRVNTDQASDEQIRERIEAAGFTLVG